MAPSSSESGFSLVETLVALFVVAMLATSGGALLVSSIKAAGVVKDTAGDVRELDVMHALLRDDLAALTRRGSLPPRGLGTPQGPMGNDRNAIALSFVRNGWARLDPESDLRSDLQRIEYRLESGRLIRLAYAAPDPTTETPVYERDLISGISEMRLQWYSDGNWYEEWETGPADLNTKLPQMLEISLQFETGDTLTQRFLVSGSLS